MTQTTTYPKEPTRDEIFNLMQKLKAILTEREQEVLQYAASTRADGSKVS